MRKHLLLLIVAMLMTTTMSAQWLKNDNLKVQRAPYALKDFSTRMMAPARVDLEENQKVMGHYDTDDYSTNGLGLTNFATVIPIATILEPEELEYFMGGKIVKFRVALAESTPVTRVFVAPVSADGYIGETTEWSCSVNAVGWNEITLSTPYELNLAEDESLMIGFDYKQTRTNHPISYAEVGDIHSSYVYLNYQGQTGWYDCGLDSYGNLSLQCIVEKAFPEYDIRVSNLSAAPYTLLGENLQFSFATCNMGTATVEAGACIYHFYVDGDHVGTATNPEMNSNKLDFNAQVPAHKLTAGRHTLTVSVYSLFGEMIEDPSSMSVDFMVYETSFPRQIHLIEEFTSNSCTYCPLGAGMLKTLMGMRDDIALVAIHGNQSAVDPCNTAQCDTLADYMYGGGWPYGSFNRSVGWEDNRNIAVGIGYYEQYHQEVAEGFSSFLDYLDQRIPSFATININSTIDDATNEVTITINGQVTPDFAAMMGEDAKLTVYLTEDGLIYRQLNMGTWEQQYEHNHVFRTALGSVFGENLKIKGNTYKNEYTIILPSDWNSDKMEVVAFISRPLANGVNGIYTDMYVNQASKRKLGEFDEPVGLLGDVNGDGAVNITDVTTLIDAVLNDNLDNIIVENADLTGEGAINISDVTELISIVLNM